MSTLIAVPEQDSDVKVVPAHPQGMSAQEDAFAARGLGEAADKAPAGPVAVIAIHGIGQQVPFEMIQTTTAMLKACEEKEQGQTPRIQVQYVTVDQEVLPRGEMELTSQDSNTAGTPLLVHLYEGYWAPITEGKVGLWDVQSFIWDAVKRGLAGSANGHFKRRIFGIWPCYQLHPNPALTLLLILLVVWTLLAVLLIGALVIVIAAANSLLQANLVWPSAGLIQDLTLDFAVIAVPGALFGLLLLWGTSHRRHHMAPLNQQGKPPYQSPVKEIAWVFLWVLLIASIAAGGLTLIHLVHHRNTVPATWPLVFAQPPAKWIHVVVAVLTWGFVMYLSWRARYWLIQFMGDTAAYISAHKVHKHQQIRADIQNEVMRVSRAVYRDQEKGRPRYERIIVLAHSLGSVIGYDVLNSLINEDNLAGNPLNVVGRTWLFLTCGSPLDKTAFIFRNQYTGDEGDPDVREALAEARQPMIQSYRFRPARWVNVWSRFDPISGDLSFYDIGEEGFDDPNHANYQPQRVINCEDWEACNPLVAHSEYFDGRTLGDILYDGVTGGALPD